MTDFVPAEKAMPVREPSTANLTIDSVDRNNFGNTTSASFSISKPNSILNGFFTRIATSEVVLDWLEPNINASFATNCVTLDISGASPVSVSVPVGFYNVAQILDAAVQRLNDISGTTSTAFVINNAVSPPTLKATNGALYWSIQIAAGNGINGFMGIGAGYYTSPGGSVYLDGVADIRRVRYIDFVSPELTYNQELKDSSTNPVVHDALCRWYMEWDNPVAYDKYGYPIFMGYSAFQVRRLFSPPKQIKWEPNMPLGQLSFQLYKDGQTPTGQALVITNPQTNWRMTLQVSEV